MVLKSPRFLYLITALTLIIGLFFKVTPDPVAASPALQGAPLILVVNSQLDNADSVPGDGLCATSGGVCTLRAAIQEANASPNTSGIDEIRFGMTGGTGTYGFVRSTVYPIITDPVVIDGTTQSGYSGVPIISLASTASISDDGLTITAGNSTVRGLMINSFHFSAVHIITGGNNVIQKNYLGTNGTDTWGSLKDGIRIENSANNLIGGTSAGAGNTITGNSYTVGSSNSGYGGIYITGSASSGNIIQGNIIGLLQDGVSPGITYGNAGNRIGIFISGAPNTIIGGTTAAARNIISNNHAEGILIGDTGGTVIQGNYIGTDISGALARGNNGAGISFANVTSLTIGGTTGVTVGGPCSGACNLISSDIAGPGINSYYGASSNLVITGNYVGTDVTGKIARGNAGQGMKLDGISNSTVGGAAAGAGNLVSANNREGIQLDYASNNVLQGNLIGTDITGTVDLGNTSDGITSNGNTAFGNRFENNTVSGNNERGIEMSSSAHDYVIVGNRVGTDITGTQPLGNTYDGLFFANGVYNIMVGGASPVDKNIIAYNSTGVTLATLTGITILGNSIFSNTGLGISGNGNYSATIRIDDVRTSTNTQVDGALTAGASQTYRLEFFANDTCDASDFGEGQTFLYATSVTTNASGVGTFNAVIPSTITNSQFITITATANNGTGGTTLFSRCAAVFEADLSIQKTANFPTRNEGSLLTYTITVTNNGPDLATTIKALDLLPPSVTYNNDDGAGSFNSVTGVWAVGNLAKNTSRTLVVNTTVKSGTLNTTFNNTASVPVLDQKDPYQQNQSSVVPVAVGANLGITQSVDHVYPMQGTNVVFSLQVTNSGPGGTTNVHVQDLLPTGLTHVSNTPSQGTYTPATGDWAIGTLAKNATVTLTLTAKVDNGLSNQLLQNMATVSSDYTDPVTGNNTASVTLAAGGSDLSVTKAANIATPDESSTVIYTVVAKNLGPNAVTGVSVNDVLPSTLTYVSSSATAGSYDASSGVWTVGNLANGVSETLQITATVNIGTASTAINNSAAIASSTSNDLNAANNTAQITINVRPPFTCDKLYLNNPTLTGSTINWTIGNTNPQPTQLTGSHVVWNAPDLATVPGMAMINQSLNATVYWTGNDPISPTDSTNPAEGIFNPTANRQIAGSSTLVWHGALSALPVDLNYYMTIWDLAGSVLYFDNPRSDEDCAVPLTLPTRPPVYNVTTTTDSNDGVCDANCSLREAIVTANTHPGATIIIPAGRYKITRSGVNEDFTDSGDFDLRATMTIIGAGAGSTLIDGNSLGRVFDLPNTPSPSRVLIKNLTITGGLAEMGGGLYVQTNSTASLLNTVVSGNVATGNFQSSYSTSGGGLLTERGTINIISSDIDANQAPVGGGIGDILGNISIINSAIHNNTGTSGGGGLSTAGSVNSVNSVVNITGSSIYNNVQDGIYNTNGSLYLTNTTISGNSGSGIMHTNNAIGSLNLTQVTIYGNQNGGLRSLSVFDVFNLKNTLIAGNTSGGVSKDCLAVKITSQGYNLLGNSSGCTFSNGTSNDILDVNANLAALANNGGPTLTHALQTGSPAINAIPSPKCGATSDQRGIIRPQGAGCDIGAFELQSASSYPLVFRINSYADTGDGKLNQNETTLAHIQQLNVTFSMDMANPAGDSGSNDATNPANYRLVSAGADGIFQTTTCPTLLGDDTAVAVNSVYYNTTTYTANLDINNAHVLPAGKYRLLVCGTLENTTGAKLDGNTDGVNGDAFTRDFTILSAPSAGFVVNSTNDAVDANPGNGVCATLSSVCTLRAAIMESNALAGANSITLPAGNYALSIAGVDEDAAATGDLDITDALTIAGAGAATTIIDGDAIDRVFDIEGEFATNISDVTIQNGGSADGIFSAFGTLNLDYVIMTSNKNAVKIFLGKLTISNSNLSNNSGSYGGAVYNDYSEVNIRNSLLSNNVATGGGAIYNYNGLLNITNSTFSGNHATFEAGGAIYSASGQPTNISFSTFVGNQAQDRGGAVAIASTSVVVNFKGTIMAQNTATAYNTGNCGYNQLNSNGYNISDDNSCQYTFTKTGDLQNTNPYLGTLADYGGPTLTYNLLIGSPAVNAIPVNACNVTIDQRGISRPKGTACDMGSFEAVPVLLPNAPTGLTLSGPTATSVTLNWTDNSSDENAFSVERSPDGTAWQTIGSVNADITTFVDNTVTCGSTYVYRLRAYRALDGLYSTYSNNASGSTPACLPADLSLTMTSTSPNIPQGNTFNYTVTVSNGGPNPAPGIEVKVTLPAGLVSISAVPAQGTYDATSGLWKVGQIAANGSAVLTLHARVGGSTYGQNLLATAEITKASVNDPDSIFNNHVTSEDDWAQNSVLVGCAPASIFNVANGDVTGLIVAIETANNATCYPAADTINLAAGGTYTLTQIYSQRDGLPPITQNLTINGNNATLQRDSGLDTPRFRLLENSTGSSLTVTDLTLQSGFPTYNTDNDISQYGGAILNQGALSVTRVRLINNNGTRGTAIANVNGAVVVTDTTFTLNDGTAGGALYSAGSASVVTVNSSTFDRNTSGRTGAISNLDGQMTVSNSTFSNNISNYLVDGIETEYGTLTLIHNTFYSNNPGSNVTLYYVSSTVQLRANIIQSAQTKMCDGVGALPVSLGYNITNSNSLCGATVSGDQINLDPQLGALGNYGGLTQTIKVEGNSPALDVIPTAQCTLSLDQRGISRPQFNGCDAGALESDSLALFMPIIISPAMNAQLSNQPNDLKWKPIFIADHYELQFGRTNPIPSPTIIVASNTYLIDEPLLQTMYYWRVRAVDGGGNTSPWSVLQQFTIVSTAMAAPSINVETSPTLTLTWSALTWATGYEVVIAKDQNFTQPYADQQQVNAETLEYITMPLAPGKYYWRVRAKKSDGTWGGWSTPQRFTIASP